MIWPFENVVETGPPSALVGRSIYAVRDLVRGFMAMSWTTGPGSFFAFHDFKIDDAGRAVWGQTLQDTAYAASAISANQPPRKPAYWLAVITGGHGALRVYGVGGSGPQFVGETTAPDRTIEYVAVFGDEIVTLSKWGSLRNNIVLTAPNGTRFLSQAYFVANLQLSPNAMVDAANMYEVGDLLYEATSAAGAVVWFVRNAYYWQLQDPNLEGFLGEPFHYLEWWNRVGQRVRLLVTHPHGILGGLLVYYFPGTGARWRLLDYVPPSGAPSNRYQFPQDVVAWDIWSGTGEYSYQGGPLWVVTTGHGTVRRFRLTPNFSTFTYSVVEIAKRFREAAEVLWYRTGGPLRHIEVAQDGTVRVVTYGRFSVRPRLFSAVWRW